MNSIAPSLGFLVVAIALMLAFSPPKRYLARLRASAEGAGHPRLPPTPAVGGCRVRRKRRAMRGHFKG